MSNWSSYNRALKERGGFTLWLSEDVLSSWHDVRGRGAIYNDMAIVAALQIRALFRLPLRQTQGFLESFSQSLGLAIAVPHYSTLSRRAGGLSFPALPSAPQGAHIVIDATGLKVYGEGEWKVRLHQQAYRRTWKKLHLATDEKTGLIVSSELTEGSLHDSQGFDAVFEGIAGDIGQVSADNAYDAHYIHEAIIKRGAKATIATRANSKCFDEGGKGHANRNAILESIRETDAKTWSRESGYCKRALAETTMSRLKKTFGGELWAKNFNNQKAEANIKIRLLNHFIINGKPKSYKIIK